MITTNISLAKVALTKNEIIALPTETVYGLAANAYSEEAIKKIFLIKQRPFFNPLIVHIKSVNFLQNIARDIPETAMKLAKAFWPGPLTLVLKKQSNIPHLVTANKDTVAIRVPNHPLALALLDMLEFPLAAPSANPFGSISPTSAAHVFNYFGENLNIILDGGACQNGVESTIIGFENEQPILYRHGSISIEEIEKLVGKLLIVSNNDDKPDAPGMLTSHYAPITKTYLTDNVNESINLFPNKKIGLLLFKDKIDNTTIAHQEILSVSGDTKEAAKNLYAALHRLDKEKLDLIIAEKLPAEELGITINDRLLRATQK